MNGSRHTQQDPTPIHAARYSAMKSVFLNDTKNKKSQNGSGDVRLLGILHCALHGLKKKKVLRLCIEPLSHSPKTLSHISKIGTDYLTRSSLYCVLI